jgi:hypothetical protein
VQHGEFQVEAVWKAHAFGEMLYNQLEEHWGQHTQRRLLLAVLAEDTHTSEYRQLLDRKL